jgi:hypothetical protein
MTALHWDGTGEKVFETGVDHGVLYIPDEDGEYTNGVAWNGLVTITQSPTGAESNKTYADNIVYGNLISVEEFEATLEAYTCPQEFYEFDGMATVANGVRVGQQLRRPFGLSWRTLMGNDVLGTTYGYKIHLGYGLSASPSEKAHTTVNDSPEMTNFSWDLTSVPTAFLDYPDLKPTSVLEIDSTTVDPTALAALELILYGDTGVDPRLPTVDEVANLFAGTATATNITVAPATDAVAIGGTTTNVRFTIDHWDGDEWVSDGEDLTEAAAEALVLVTGTVYQVRLSATANHYIPAAQQTLHYVVPT